MFSVGSNGLGDENQGQDGKFGFGLFIRFNGNNSWILVYILIMNDNLINIKHVFVSDTTFHYGHIDLTCFFPAVDD